MKEKMSKSESITPYKLIKKEMFLFAFFFFFSLEKEAKETINLDKQFCCKVPKYFSGFIIQKNEKIDNNIVSLDSKLDDLPYLMNVLGEHSFVSAIDWENSTYQIIQNSKDSSSTFKNQFPELDFLFTTKYDKAIYSSQNCFDQKQACNHQDLISIIQNSYFQQFAVLFIITFLIGFIYISFIKFLSHYSIFTPNLDPAFKTNQTPHKLKKYEEYIVNQSMKAHKKDPYTYAEIANIKRGYPSSQFNLLFPFELKDGRFLFVKWEERYDDNDEIRADIKLTSSEFKSERISIEMKKYRLYRPFRVHVKLNSSANLTFEIPLPTLQAFLPNGCETTMVDSGLIGCTNVTLSKGILNTEFEQFIIHHCQTLHSLICIILNNTGDILFEHMREDYDASQLTTEIRNEFLQNLPDTSQEPLVN